VPRNIGVRPHAETDLVYLEESPDYCVKNLKEGTMGVADRRCNKTSPGPDGCDVMCCGTGFRTKTVQVVSNCKCKFLWCCEVKCEKCSVNTKQHFCRGKKKRRKNRRKNRNRKTFRQNKVQRDDPTSYILKKDRLNSIELNNNR